MAGKDSTPLKTPRKIADAILHPKNANLGNLGAAMLAAAKEK